MQLRKVESGWQVYRTRFLIRAKQLTEPLMFKDALGREHCGQIGDYLVESSDGARRIALREIFEDVYVAMGPANMGPANMGPANMVPAESAPADMGPADGNWCSPTQREMPVSALKRRVSSRAGAPA
jgi:hypothetical protein